MNMRRRAKGWLLPVTIVLALLLGLVPLPEMIQPIRPYWLGLVLAYWVLESPERAGLGLAFFCGLIADVCWGVLLGEQALRLLLIAFVISRFRAQLRFYLLPQQMLVIGGLLLADRALQAFLHLLFGLPQLPILYWLGPLFGMLLWIPLYLLMDALRMESRR